jgi:hypothetical protein
MILKDYYWYFQSALTEDQCNRIRARGHTRLKEIEKAQGKKATVAQVGGRQSVHNAGGVNKRKRPGVGTKEDMRKAGIDVEETYARDSYVAFFSDPWIYEIVHPFLREANQLSGWDFDVSYSEQLQFTRYESEGEGKQGQFYGWHMDGQWQPYKLFDESNPRDRLDAILHDENNEEVIGEHGNPVFVDNSWTTHSDWVGKVRKLSMTVNLTNPDEYKGGEFQIDRGPHFQNSRYYTVSEIAQQGSIIIFPSFVPHQVTPIVKGVRESLVMWSIGPKWK